MKSFRNYARYYNLLYRDKDYKSEALFVHQIIKKYNPRASSILELGCGTGKHATVLARERYTVHGVDSSSRMLEMAKHARALDTEELQTRLKFSPGDVRDIRCNTTYDVVISLFHVASYQASNTDLEAFFATAKAHLRPGGIFIFDAWYGPAVLTDRPVVRVKRIEDDAFQVIRIAEPIMHPHKNLVDVAYHVFIINNDTKDVEEIRETHTMRYLFQPELEKFLRDKNFELIVSQEWMTDRDPGFDTWGVYFVARLH